MKELLLRTGAAEALARSFEAAAGTHPLEPQWSADVEARIDRIEAAGRDEAGAAWMAKLFAVCRDLPPAALKGVLESCGLGEAVPWVRRLLVADAAAQTLVVPDGLAEYVARFHGVLEPWLLHAVADDGSDDDLCRALAGALGRDAVYSRWRVRLERHVAKVATLPSDSAELQAT